MASRFIFTRLLVADVPASLAFYRDALGFAAGYADAEGNYADLETGEVGIALFKREHMSATVGTASQPDTPAGQDRLALIFQVPSVDEAHARLRAQGVAFLTEPRDMPDWGIRVAHLRDPDGNLIELNQPLAR